MKKSMKRKMLGLLGGVLAMAGALGFSTAEAAPVALQSDETVTVEKVTFDNDGVKMVGNLYKPRNLEKGKTYAAISVAHSWGGVKEQTSGLYAKKLAAKGFITLAYDASHYGESGGTPRFAEVPADRVKDISSVIDYLANRPEVDKDAIGALGICAGGGYTIAAAETDLRIKAVAGVSSYDVGDAARNGLRNVWDITPAECAQQLKDAAEQRTKEAAGEKPLITKLLPTEKPGADAPQFVQNAFDYYNTERGHAKNATGNFRFTSTIQLMQFYPFLAVDTISPRPLLMFAGENAQSRYFSEEAYAAASEPKELVIVPGATHFDLYDKAQFVDPIVDKLAEFYHRYLK